MIDINGETKKKKYNTIRAQKQENFTFFFTIFARKLGKYESVMT